jgi:dTDP-4-dehydrorhamnose 3,5-epimerase
MQQMKLHIEGVYFGAVKVFSHEIFGDHRGFFMEVYRRDVFAEAGLPTDFVQINLGGSTRGVLRGLHFQWEPPMGKLMRVPRGEALVVAVDIRYGSPTLGRWHAEMLSDSNRRQMWAPAGFARGYYVLSEYAEVEYLCTGIYNGAAESNILWNDPEIGLEWGASNPILSARDTSAQTLKEWLARPEAQLFSYPGLFAEA